jgi:hypothetical protein
MYGMPIMFSSLSMALISGNSMLALAKVKDWRSAGFATILQRRGYELLQEAHQPGAI